MNWDGHLILCVLDYCTSYGFILFTPLIGFQLEFDYYSKVSRYGLGEVNLILTMRAMNMKIEWTKRSSSLWEHVKKHLTEMGNSINFRKKPLELEKTNCRICQHHREF
jgi:hypothetical protein